MDNRRVLAVLFLVLVLLTGSGVPNPVTQNEATDIECIDEDRNEVVLEARPEADTTLFSRLTTIISVGVNRIVNLHAETVVEDGEFAVLSRCTQCRVAVSMFEFMQNFHHGPEAIPGIVDTVCTKLNIEKADVCHGIVHEFRNEFIQVISNLTIPSSDVCAFVFGCGTMHDQAFNWTIPVPNRPSARTITDMQWPVPLSGAPQMKVLHISDVHIDPNYGPGSNAICGEPLCCQKGSLPAFPAAAAGKWGDYRDCDMPWETFDTMMEAISATHKDIDYIIWTGDVSAHNVWNQSRADQIAILRSVSGSLKRHFNSTPIYPALGNHESNPVNSFPPPQVDDVSSSISWLYDELYNDWGTWLPAAAMDHVRKGAYYAIDLTSHLRLISLNMNYCNNMNWWLLIKEVTKDPADELQWLINELLAAEAAGKKVHIIGHIPPGSGDCITAWSANYYRIVSRFADSIVAQFFGHTHMDGFELFFEPLPHEHNEKWFPTGIAYVGPSVTTFGGVNPGYRIYTIDGDHNDSTYQVMDFENYYTDLSRANARDDTPPRYNVAYSPVRDFNISPLSPQNWLNFLKKIYRNETEFERYYACQPNLSEYYLDGHKCKTDDCRKSFICDRLSGRSHDDTFCNRWPNI